MFKKIITAFLITITLTSAQDTPQQLTWFVKPEIPVTKNMIFLFDCSTSMGRNDRMKTAVGQVNTILHQPLDDGMFSLLTFKAIKDHVRIWEGYKDKDDDNPPPNNWAKLPSIEAIESANQFLNHIECDNYTDITSGLNAAFKLAEHIKECTIIIFTDGNNTYPFFNGKPPQQVRLDILDLEKERRRNKLNYISIYVFGLSVEQNVSMLSIIAKTTGGGYLTTYEVCPLCLKMKNCPEVQREHRINHVEPEDDDDFFYDGDW